MPDNNVPATNPDPEAMPGEFDFAKPVEQNPRVRRRLKSTQLPSQGVGSTPREHAAKTEIRPTVTTKPASPAPTSTAPAPSATKATQSVSNTAYTRPTPTSTQPTSPHGTRPATLYYSSGTRQEKEETPPMKTTPTASTPSSTSVPSTTSPARTATSATRPSSVIDYRTNVERQTREQKSVGGVLSILVYTLIGLFVLGAALAGYGAYVVQQALHNQSVTVAQLDARYDAANKDLNARLATTLDTLTQAQAQIGRQQDLILKQQETINRLLTATEENASAITKERETRADETSTLRSRIKDLEFEGPITRKY